MLQTEKLLQHNRMTLIHQWYIQSKNELYQQVKLWKLEENAVS
jgi:hypothetical protein